jgi:hypothetical protein
MPPYHSKVHAPFCSPLQNFKPKNEEKPTADQILLTTGLEAYLIFWRPFFFFLYNNKLYYACLTKIQIYLHMFKPEGGSRGKRRTRSADTCTWNNNARGKRVTPREPPHTAQQPAQRKEIKKQ